MTEIPWIDAWASQALPWQTLDIKLPPNSRAFALLDMAFAPQTRRRLQKIAPVSSNLFDGCYSGQGLAALSPCLLELPLADAGKAQTLWTKLLSLCQGRPMLSVLLTQYSLAELAAHLRAQLNAVSADEQAFIVRLADSRILPQLLQVFSDPQRQRLMNGVQAWYYPGHDGSWKSAVGLEPADNLADAGPFRLSHAQTQALQRLGLGDAILRYMQTRPSFNLAGLLPSKAYAEITQILTQLQQQSLDDEALAYRLCGKALIQAAKSAP